ncbi:hypothetical protein Pmani_034443 [Petrolisthes manimaculis]|uniref:Chitin-binding type-2 domain-containing protein n=1 Tax=Petrolisthes manimaculis TaxID=1843537 RepID=A0AAE1TP44_9EUCA|nr:hypothetical protein Pmani_034443 [Petrolisthes manimaculis]
MVDVYKCRRTKLYHYQQQEDDVDDEEETNYSRGGRVSNQTQVRKKHSLSCTKEGRFAIPWKLGSYMECVEGKGNEAFSSLTSHLYTCPKGHYQQTQGGCVLDQTVGAVEEMEEEEKTYRGGIEEDDDENSSLPVRSSDHDWLCKGGTGFACGSCLQVVVCAEFEAYIQSCPSSTRCVPHHSFTGGVCYPEWKKETCGCETGGITLPDPYNPVAFLQCDSPHLPPDLYFCSDGNQFDVSTSSCVNVPTEGVCSVEGVFPVQGECRWFYICLKNSAGEWVKQFSLCPDSLVYSRVLGKCEDPFLVPQIDPCSQRKKKKTKRYICTLWQLIWVFFFPHKVSYICIEI